MWSVVFLVLAISFYITKGYNDSIIFLVDESVEISEEHCKKQQNGISDYFQFLYEEDNLLSYIGFNQLGEINKIIDFNDAFHIPFDNLVAKIQSIDCSNDYSYKNRKHSVQNIENDFNKINLALSSSFSTYNRSDMKTPMIILFTYFQLKTNHTNSPNYMSSIFDCNNLLSGCDDDYFADLMITLVNFNSMPSDNNFISDYYSNCLGGLQQSAFSYFQVFSLKNVEYNTFLENKEIIIYQTRRGLTVPQETDPPTNKDTNNPTNNPTKAPTTSSDSSSSSSSDSSNNNI